MVDPTHDGYTRIEEVDDRLCMTLVLCRFADIRNLELFYIIVTTTPTQVQLLCNETNV